MLVRVVFLFCIVICCLTCSSKVTRNVIKNSDDLLTTGRSYVDTTSNLEKQCGEASSYLPGALNDIRTKVIRVNVHFMNSTDSLNNYNSSEAIAYAKSLIGNANERLGRNKKMIYPRNGSSKPIQPRYRYKLTTYDHRRGDIYFHYDDKLYYFLNKGKGRNNYNREVVNKYEVRADSVVNVFIMPHHPDTLKRSYYKGGNAGIALGHSVKLAGDWMDKKAWWFGTLFNHEIGHVLGLRHTWNENDGCDDTPKHKQCWDCADAGNNMMDYNNSQMAITPCQISRVHRNMTRVHYDQRDLVIPDWCIYNPKYDVLIDRDIVWDGERDIAGDIIIKNGATLTLRCRVSLPSEGRIEVRPGGRLILDGCKLHNSCDYYWDGIQTFDKGGKTGQVLYLNDPVIENVAE